MRTQMEEPISKREGQKIEQEWTRNMPKSETKIEDIEKLWPTTTWIEVK